MIDNPDDSKSTSPAQPKPAAWKLAWLVAVIAVLAVSIGAFMWLQGNKVDQTESLSEDSRQEDDGPIIMTAEERYRFENIKRAEGVIETVDGDSLVLKQSGGRSLELQLISETQYVRGEQAYAGDKQAVTPGKKASISYDQNNDYVQTIWVDYDVAINN